MKRPAPKYQIMGAKQTRVVCDKCNRTATVTDSFECCGERDTIKQRDKGRQLVFKPNWRGGNKFHINRAQMHYIIICKKCEKRHAWFGKESGPRFSCCVILGKVPPLHYPDYTEFEWDGEDFKAHYMGPTQKRYMPPEPFKLDLRPIVFDMSLVQPVIKEPEKPKQEDPEWFRCPGCNMLKNYEGPCSSCRGCCKKCHKPVAEQYRPLVTFKVCPQCTHSHKSGYCGGEFEFSERVVVPRTVARTTYTWGSRVDPYGGLSYNYGPEMSTRYETETDVVIRKKTVRCPCTAQMEYYGPPCNHEEIM